MASAYLDRHISYWQHNMPRTRRCCTFGAIDKAISKQASAAASSRPQVLTHQGLSGPVTQIRGSASGVDACHGMPRPYHQNSTGSLLPDLRTEMQDDPDVAPKYGYHPTKMTNGPYARYTHRCLTGRCDSPPLAQGFVLRFQTHQRREFRDRVGRSGDGRHAAPQSIQLPTPKGAKRGVPFLRSSGSSDSIKSVSRTAHSNAALPRLFPGNAPKKNFHSHLRLSLPQFKLIVSSSPVLGLPLDRPSPRQAS
ncbi:hypothetical protein BO85DRAFT_495662 [Aspergillus piperis CBS 112811]|uniref:Uncharacterized protein n=1 Tax=Aspergillus piperis CBS 112811 TaxID=1448313 RepID=A0A8G1RCE2_9EURO|nr:hypothetical protein BO85DRAFT_495662 [Aspergillus piperis CBS 112811]RAH63628.1 hypothetical protein BO85DRAFT_495662 [Aspergillus piperis CBS 112811]